MYGPRQEPAVARLSREVIEALLEIRRERESPDDDLSQELPGLDGLGTRR